MVYENDYVMRLIARLIALLAKILEKKSIDHDQQLDAVVEELSGLDPALLQVGPAALLQLLNLACAHDANKKAMLCLALYERDRKRHQAVYQGLLKTLEPSLIHLDLREALERRSLLVSEER